MNKIESLCKEEEIQCDGDKKRYKTCHNPK